MTECVDVSGRWEVSRLPNYPQLPDTEKLVTMYQTPLECTGRAFDYKDDDLWHYSITFDEIKRKDNVRKEVGQIQDNGLKIVWYDKAGGDLTGETYDKML